MTNPPLFDTLRPGMVVEHEDGRARVIDEILVFDDTTARVTAVRWHTRGKVWDYWTSPVDTWNRWATRARVVGGHDDAAG